MTTFKMPGLSRYSFDEKGNAYGVKMRQLSPYVDRNWIAYKLRDDNDKVTAVSTKEIIQYGKHLKEMAMINMMRSIGLPIILVEPKPVSFERPKDGRRIPNMVRRFKNRCIAI